MPRSNNKFCYNPKCSNHISVKPGVDSIQVGNIQVDLTSQYKPVLVKRHQFITQTGKTVFFCSACRNAILMSADCC